MTDDTSTPANDVPSPSTLTAEQAPDMHQGHLKMLDELRTKLRLETYKVMNALPKGRESAALMYAISVIGDLVGLLYPTSHPALIDTLMQNLARSVNAVANASPADRAQAVAQLGEELASYLTAPGRAAGGRPGPSSPNGQRRIIVPNGHMPSLGPLRRR